jgi:hypothetical protein
MQVENIEIQVPNFDQSFGSRNNFDLSRMHILMKTLENMLYKSIDNES